MVMSSLVLSDLSVWDTLESHPVRVGNVLLRFGGTLAFDTPAHDAQRSPSPPWIGVSAALCTCILSACNAIAN
jgi:hypothetical protein